MRAALALALTCMGSQGSQAQVPAPSLAQREQVLRALVQVSANDCADGSSRSGSGFVLEPGARVVTAHHVVGGCKQIQVSFEALKPPQPRLRSARIVRVLAAGDLSLLDVSNPPPVPSLRLAAGAPARDHSFVGFGYPLGTPTAGDQTVTFSVGAQRLADILPDAAAEELRRSGSRIAVEREVLRFNVPLQPGMSGGPIVDAAGEVIGVVAGGLKAGAAPVSWGWPSEGVRQLLRSTEAVEQTVRLTGLQYSLADLQRLASAAQSGRRLRCGELEFTDNGTRTLAELMRGADDWQRVQYILHISGENPQRLSGELYQVWVHAGSGATAVVPAGYELHDEAGTCVARSAKGPFQLLVWAARAPTDADVQWKSSEFEQRVIAPRMPYNYGAQIDPQLSTLVPNALGQLVPGRQDRANGLVFNRKGFTLAKRPAQFPGDIVPLAHGFHTLVARSGSFLGVAALNDAIDPRVYACRSPNPPAIGCVGAMLHLSEWTRFVLATQLSTFPAY